MSRFRRLYRFARRVGCWPHRAFLFALFGALFTDPPPRDGPGRLS